MKDSKIRSTNKQIHVVRGRKIQLEKSTMLNCSWHVLSLSYLDPCLKFKGSFTCKLHIRMNLLIANILIGVIVPEEQFMQMATNKLIVAH